MEVQRIFYLSSRSRYVSTLLVATLLCVYSLLLARMSIAQSAGFVAGVSACTFFTLRSRVTVMASSIQLGKRRMPFADGVFELEPLSGLGAWLAYGRSNGYALSYTPHNGKKRRLYFSFEDGDVPEMQALLDRLGRQRPER